MPQTAVLCNLKYEEISQYCEIAFTLHLLFLSRLRIIMRVTFGDEFGETLGGICDLGGKIYVPRKFTFEYLILIFKAIAKISGIWQETILQ